MEESQIYGQEQTAGISSVRQERPTPHAPSVQAGQTVSPQACPSCRAASEANGGSTVSPSWVYAIGRIEARFPGISIEKEFAQATGRADTKGLADRQALEAVLSKPENRYLARQLCFVMTIQELETYILVPRDPADVMLLLDALRPTPQPWDLDVVIGMKGPIAPPRMCNGLIVPIVIFDQIYSFDREALIKAIPRPESTSREEFAPAAEELFDRIIRMTDNSGATDGDRALNYLAMRYQAIYATAAEAFARSASLTSVDVQPARPGGIRTLVDVIFTFTSRVTGVDEKFAVRVDVTDEFPFLVTRLGPYYSR